jgi:hypothetical protein
VKHASLIAVLLLAGFLSACSKGQPPEPQTYQLEEDTVRLIPPSGWEHLDYGRLHQFRFGRARLTLELTKAYPYPPQVEVILAKLGHDSRRSIASMRSVVVDDREVLVVETWDHLSHAMPMRVAIVPCSYRQLVLHTRYGAYEESIEAFDTVLASIDIIEPESRSSSPREDR